MPIENDPISIELSLTRATAVEPSPRVLRIASMFGLGIDEQRLRTIVEPTSLQLTPGDVVFITGPSGGGKSSILHLIESALACKPNVVVHRFDALPDPPDRPLIDALAADWPNATLADLTRTLSLAGLNDAFVMLRKPSELSDGQRYRYRLAQVFAHVARQHDAQTHAVLADEFGATLDRLTAAVIARNVRRWTRRDDVRDRLIFIAATTHDDLLEPLDPDVLIEKRLGSTVSVATRADREAEVHQ